MKEVDAQESCNDTGLRHQQIVFAMEKTCFAWQGLSWVVDEDSTALGGPENFVVHQSQWNELAAAAITRLARKTGQLVLQDLGWSWGALWWVLNGSHHEKVQNALTVSVTSIRTMN